MPGSTTATSGQNQPSCDVRFGPKADILFDDLVGAQQEGYRDCQVNRLGRFKIHNQLKSRRVLYREVGRLGTFENSIHVVSCAAKAIIPIEAVGHQTTSCYVLGESIDGRHPITPCLIDDHCCISNGDRVRERNQSTVRFLRERLDDTFDLSGVMYATRYGLYLQSRRDLLD